MIKKNLSLGSVLKEKRHSLGLTQTEVAQRAGIVLQQYQKLESGERSIMNSSFYISCKILQALELNLNDFFDQNKDKVV